ncbi:MAG: Flp family type IVb pilin [Alphaproteobacteria bacterium]|nr:Flp family type IVb pilin [Alphaproteobacteria bacterium]
MRPIRDLLSDQSGATALEYGLIAAIIAVSLVVVMQSIGVSVAGIYGIVTDAFASG